MTKSKFSNCDSCPLLSQTMVLGETNSKNNLKKVKLLILAEAPAATEVKIGLPLQGKAGKVFRTEFEGSMLNTIPYYIGNVVSCANLHKNESTGKIITKNPPKEAIDCCRPNWEMLVKVLQPDCILIMGATAQDIFGIPGQISDTRGQFYEYNGDISSMSKIPKVFLTFYPSFIGRGSAPLYKIEQFKEDFRTLYTYITGIKNEYNKEEHLCAKLKIDHPYHYDIPQWLKTDDITLIDVQTLKTTNQIVYSIRDKNGKKKFYKTNGGNYYYYKRDGILGNAPVLSDIKDVEVILKQQTGNTGDALYESDVKTEIKHSIDYYLQRKTPEKIQPLQKIFLDIEVYSGGNLAFPDPKIAPKPINAISFVSSTDNITNVMIVNPKNFVIPKNGKTKEDYDLTPEKLKSVDHNNCKVIVFSSERSLLTDFAKIISQSGTDILGTWNGNGFDIPYIYNRVKKLAINTNSLSPLNHVVINPFKFGDNLIAGVHHCDMLQLYKDLTENKKESYALGAIAKSELGEGKVEYEGSLDNLYENDIEKFIRYSGQDSNLLYELDQKLGHIDLKDEMRRVCHTTWKGTESTTGLLDPLCISYAKERGLVFRNSEMTKSKENLPGAYVRNPVAGLYRWIIDLDYRSLYPSIIISCNIGPDTYIGKINPVISHTYIYERDKLPNNIDMFIHPMKTNNTETKTFTKKEFLEWINENKAIVTTTGSIFIGQEKKVSFMSEICSMLLSTRVVFKDKMKVAKKAKDPIWNLYYNRQWVYKILANSLYGVLGTFSFRLFKLDLAKTITLTGQEAIKFAGHHLSKYMHTGDKNIDTDFLEDFEEPKKYLMYTDTDSLFLNISDYLLDKNIPF